MSKETEMLLLSHGMDQLRRLGVCSCPPQMGGHHNPSSDVSSTGACLGILNLPTADLRVLISMKLEGSWEEIPRGDPGHSSAQHELLLLEHSQGFTSETAAGHICNQLQKQLCRISLPCTGDSSIPLAAPVCFQTPALCMHETNLSASSRGKRVLEPWEGMGFSCPSPALLLAPHMICLYGTTLVLAFGPLKSDQL